MRCQEQTGFLMIHACDNAALYTCAYCGKNLCEQHAIPLPTDAQNPTQGKACRECQRRQNQSDIYDDDYPYYGRYHPYYYGGYTAHDRRVFDRQPADGQAENADDTLGS